MWNYIKTLVKKRLFRNKGVLLNAYFKNQCARLTQRLSKHKRQLLSCCVLFSFVRVASTVGPKKRTKVDTNFNFSKLENNMSNHSGFCPKSKSNMTCPKVFNQSYAKPNKLNLNEVNE